MISSLRIWFYKRNSPEAGRLKPEVKFIHSLLPSAFCLLLTILLITACNPDNVFEKHTKLENYSWNHFQKLSFEVNIEEENRDYDIYIAIRYVEGIPYRILKTGVQIIFPDGQERYNDYEFPIRNKDGSYKGSVAGDIWDYPVPILKKYPLHQKGNYEFIIHNMMEKLETPGIMEIGLIVKKAE